MEEYKYNILENLNLDRASLEEAIDQCYEATGEDVISVGYGFKEIDGKLTREKCLVFGVKKKLAVGEIKENDLIPSRIRISGIEFPTDVVEHCEIVKMDCEQFNDSINNSIGNRSVVRPVQGGVSAINTTEMCCPYPSACTLGFVAVDDFSGEMVGVTNVHCAAKEPFLVSERDYVGVYAGNEVIQPSEAFDWPNEGISNHDANPISITIGFVQRLNYLKIGECNYTDGATYSLLKSEIDEYSSCRQYGLSMDCPRFATTGELDDLLNSDPLLFSSGRTTGPKGEGAVKLRLSGTNNIITIGNWGLEPNLVHNIKFCDIIGFIATEDPDRPFDSYCYNPIAPGDSGSALLADINGEVKIIGLVFAGSMDGEGRVTRGFACRIDKVAEDLCISEYIPPTPTPTPTATPTPT